MHKVANFCAERWQKRVWIGKVTAANWSNETLFVALDESVKENKIILVLNYKRDLNFTVDWIQRFRFFFNIGNIGIEKSENVSITKKKCNSNKKGIFKVSAHKCYNTTMNDKEFPIAKPPESLQ